MKEKEETRGSKGVFPLALQKQTCQKLRKIQGKGLAIKGKTKNCMKKKQKRGSKGGPPRAEDRNFATKREKINIAVQEGFLFFPITVVPP